MTTNEKIITDQEMDMKKDDNQPDKAEKEEKKKESSKGRKSKGKKKAEEAVEAEFKQQIDELNDKYLRLYSEFDNFRRRTSKEKLELAKTASEELMIELLPVLDDFERATKSAEDIQDCGAVKEGMDLIHSKLKTILTKKGLAPIEAKGGEFDTDFHEAITYIPAPSDDLKGKVVDEIEKGYKLNDKVIRYSKVVIGQ
jgi:molecular chaperone GrpE